MVNDSYDVLSFLVFVLKSGREMHDAKKQSKVNVNKAMRKINGQHTFRALTISVTAVFIAIKEENHVVQN